VAVLWQASESLIQPDLFLGLGLAPLWVGVPSWSAQKCCNPADAAEGVLGAVEDDQWA
jgi:hypothetical protein